ncbi:MAG: transposase [Acidobacteriia bacterium]|nr:transposase [Terriglobia bacterium]
MNAHGFTALSEAKEIIEAWRQEYNESRPHRALGERTPNEFTCQVAASRDLTGQQEGKKSLCSWYKNSRPLTCLSLDVSSGPHLATGVRPTPLPLLGSMELGACFRYYGLGLRPLKTRC